MTEVVDRVRAELERAERTGERRPGQHKLAKRTDATRSQVRTALKKLATAGDSWSPGAASPPPVNGHHSDTETTAVLTNGHAPGFAGDLLAAPGDQESPAVANLAPGHRQPPPAEPNPAPETARKPPRKPTSWPLLIIGLGAAVAIWSGWVGLGELTGFGDVRLLPGLVNGAHLNTAVVLPLSVEAYGAYALRVWLGVRGLTWRTRRFARFSSVASLVIGAGAQVAYHLLVAAGVHAAPWPVVVLVACVPVVVLGLASALARLVTSDRQPGASESPADSSVPPASVRPSGRPFGAPPWPTPTGGPGASPTTPGGGR